MRSAGIKLVNESALGVFVFSWLSAGGKRCVLTWCEGMDAPAFEFFISGRGRMSPPVPVRNPERFGWAGPPRNLGAFKPFAQCFADACEADADDKPGDVPASAPADRPAPAGGMSATVSRDQLADALALAVRTVPRRPGLPILAGVMLRAEGGRLAVESFDHEVRSRTLLPGTVTGCGCVLVDAKTLRGMIRSLPKVRARRGHVLPDGAGMVTLTDTGAELAVGYGGKRLIVETMPADKYPPLPELGGPVATVDAASLAAVLARVTPAAGTDQTLPMLTGVEITPSGDGSAARLAATNRERAALDRIDLTPIACGPGVHIAPAVVPATALTLVAKTFAETSGVLTVYQAHTTGQIPAPDRKGWVTRTIARTIGFTDGTVTITTTALDGSFPNVSALLPKRHDSTARVSASTLAAALTRVSVGRDPKQGVVLTFRPDRVDLTPEADHPEPGAPETVPCESTADGFAIRFNPRYLLDSLQVMPKGAEVTFGMRGQLQPVTLESGALPDYRYLVMSMRMDRPPAFSKPAPGADEPAGFVSGWAEMPAPVNSPAV